ncbi:MAG: hypothetical protein GEU90_16860 [Gemmatimonas sp.]|nr:hypothetical protein [Gemmatimonas sp.]
MLLDDSEFARFLFGFAGLLRLLGERSLDLFDSGRNQLDRLLPIAGAERLTPTSDLAEVTVKDSVAIVDLISSRFFFGLDMVGSSWYPLGRIAVFDTRRGVLQ